MSILNLRLPESLHKQLRELAKQGGVSINQLAQTALVDKVAALMTSESLEQRARRGGRDSFESALSKVRDAEPGPCNAPGLEAIRQPHAERNPEIGRQAVISKYLFDRPTVTTLP